MSNQSTDIISHNPLLKRPLLALLSIAEQNPNAERSVIEGLAATKHESLFKRQTPTTIVDILIRNNALLIHLLVDGEPYQGTLGDLQTDTTVNDDATLEQRVDLTDTGKNLLTTYSEGIRIRKLFREKPHYVAVFKKVLELCEADSGCSRAELEQSLQSMPELTPHLANGAKTLYPQYFIAALEEVDGITWQGTWKTTETGRLVM